MIYCVRLLKRVHFKCNTQWVICPVGRCLEVVEEDIHGWWVEIEEGEGHGYLPKGDGLAVEATVDDMATEPEYNDYEAFDAVERRRRT
ncbi:MAG: hypothetical protein AB7L09_02695 [Nitrospira sp.]